MRFILFVSLFTMFVVMPSYADSAPEEQIKARLINRVGTVSEDHRSNTHDLKTPLGPGPKTGCVGDTLDASVSITNVAVEATGSSSFTITVSYSGKYHRQGWERPCVHSPPPRGHENLNITGQAIVTVSQEFLRPPMVTFGEFKNLGEKADPNHDSNRMARRALEAAIRGAF
jgi:hypothetical protein